MVQLVYTTLVVVCLIAIKFVFVEIERKKVKTKK